ncbi:MAG: sigma-70 family RNA polymerase sigma factor [Verrucomicrobiota bacterium]
MSREPTGAHSTSAAKSSDGSKTRPQVMNSLTGGDRSEEVAIFDRMAEREPGSLEELYQLYANPLYSYAYKMVGNQEDAEEILQDTFVRLWRRAPDFDASKSRPFSFSVMILRGLCVDCLRRRGRRPQRAFSIDDLDLADGRGTESIERLFFSDLTRRVRRALQRFPEQDRQCLELAIFGDITHTEIAGQLGQPLGTVKSRIRRGMIRLRTLLQEIHD